MKTSNGFFNPFRELSPIFIKFKIVVCKISIWKVVEFVVWKRVRDIDMEIGGIEKREGSTFATTQSTLKNLGYSYF